MWTSNTETGLICKCSGLLFPWLFSGESPQVEMSYIISVSYNEEKTVV